MKLKALHIKNFRGYRNPVSIEFDNLTTFIGKNDIGKSSILDALEIFFNNDIVKIDQSDANINGDKSVEIICDFCDLPKFLVLDSGEQTTLQQEYLTLDEDILRIKKVYDCSKKKVGETVYIVANYPQVDEFKNLLSLKERDLQNIIRERGIDSALKGNPTMRRAIWKSFDSLTCKPTDIEISSIKEDGKEIWSKISSYLPAYALFQSDRNSQDSDDEVQNPMKGAIQEAISELENEINIIKGKVKVKAMEIANQTHEALRKIDETFAKSLTPKFTDPTLSKWNGLFSINMDTDEGISLNKRGSGVRRMILVGFFMAESLRRSKTSKKKDIIYAIEEPETAQHPDNQRILLKSFVELSNSANCQVVLTTHNPNFAENLPTNSLRFIENDSEGIPHISQGETIFQNIVDALGIYSAKDNAVQIILCVEGPTDVPALMSFSRCLREKDMSIVDLSSDPRIAIIPLGGSILRHWVEHKYLKKFNLPEVHIYDNDVSAYQKSADTVNARGDGSWAVLTKKYEIENYLHSDAVREEFDINVNMDAKGVPSLIATAYYEANKDKLDNKWKDTTTKKNLSKVFDNRMNYERLMQRDTEGEILDWFTRIGKMLK